MEKYIFMEFKKVFYLICPKMFNIIYFLSIKHFFQKRRGGRSGEIRKFKKFFSTLAAHPDPAPINNQIFRLKIPSRSNKKLKFNLLLNLQRMQKKRKLEVIENFNSLCFTKKELNS